MARAWGWSHTCRFVMERSFYGIVGHGSGTYAGGGGGEGAPGIGLASGCGAGGNQKRKTSSCRSNSAMLSRALRHSTAA